MSKPKTFRPWNPEQTLLLPPSPVEWLPEQHLVFFLLDLVAELDLSAIVAVYEQRDPRGVKAYDPRMMVVLLLYAYCVGIPSSRRIERACWEDAAFRVLTGNQQPDHSRISDFRRVHLDSLTGLFVQVLRLCQKAGLMSLAMVALDGTKIKANASKHKAMSHERMLKAEAQLEAEIAALLRKAELIDAQEDKRYGKGKGKRGDELPKELQRRQDRIQVLRKARAELEAEAAADHARQRERKARCADRQAAAAQAKRCRCDSSSRCQYKGGDGSQDHSQGSPPCPSGATTGRGRQGAGLAEGRGGWTADPRPRASERSPGHAQPQPAHQCRRRGQGQSPTQLPLRGPSATPIPTATSSKAETAGSRVTTARWRSMETTR